MPSWTSPPIEIDTDTHHKILSQLQAIVGSDYVSDDFARCEAYSADFGVVPRHRPHFVIRPFTSEDIQAIIKVATEYKIPVVPRGAGTAQEGG